MGLTKNERKTFLSINGNGKIAQSLKQSEPGCVERKLDNGRIVYQMEHDGLEGKITGMNFHEHPEWGNFLYVTVDNEFLLQLKCGSKYYYSFCYALPNVDLSKNVKLSPWRKEVDGKVKAALYINQGGDKSVEWFFSKDKPNGLPEMEKKKVKGKEVWDDTDRQEFLENYLKENIFPKLGAATPVSTESVDDVEGGDDEAPF